jgi:hypothetical protein
LFFGIRQKKKEYFLQSMKLADNINAKLAIARFIGCVQESHPYRFRNSCSMLMRSVRQAIRNHFDTHGQPGSVKKESSVDGPRLEFN